jgi:hypothetical protein
MIIISCLLILNWNIDLKANNLDNEKNNTSTSRANKHSRTGDFDWRPIEIISEPIPGLNNNINSSERPKIAIEDDKVYVVWADETDYNGAGGDKDIFYRYFDGNIWSDIQVISEPIEKLDLNNGTSNVPDIAVENGKIFVVWQDDNNTHNTGTDSDIFFRCNLSGSNWEDIQIISEPIQGQNFNTRFSIQPEIAIENNKIYVIWHDYNNTNSAGTDLDVFLRCNLTGSGWGDIQVISEPVIGRNFNTEPSFGSAIAVEDGKIHVVWIDSNNMNNASSIYHDYDIFYRYNINGFNWEDIQVISEPKKGFDINSGFSSRPAIAVEKNNVYVVWEDDNNTYNSDTDLDIFFRCNLFGSFWEPIQVISEPVIGQNLNYKDSTSPKIDIENSRIYVIWDDNNNTNNADEDSDIFYKCNFTGFSWESTQVISEPIKNNNLNTQSSWSPDFEVQLGKTHIIWEDDSNLSGSGFDDDIFYRCIKDPSPLFLNQPNVSPIFGNTSTNFNFTISYFNYDNIPPKDVTVDISGIEFSMKEVDKDDTNYVDGKEYFLNIKDLDIGIHTFQFYASDGSYSWSTKLVNKPIVYNTAPIIITNDHLTVFEDEYYEVDYNYEDIDLVNVGQIGTWEFSTNAEWLTFDKATATLNGTPTNDDVGKYWVNISIDDTIDSDFTNFTLTVINVNDAPIILTNDTIVINEDDLYEVSYEALDVDTPQNSMNWFMNTNASWLKFDQKSATLSGLPENDNVGEFWVNISVSDGEYIDSSNFTLKVLNVNDPPKIITKEIAVAYEDNYYEMDFEANDIDNVQNDLNWTINTNAQWLNVDNTNSIINGTPTNDDVGEYWVNLSVTDGEYIDYRNLTLKVENTNDPPKIIVREIINGKKIVFEIEYARVGELYSRNFEVEDIDPLPQTFSWYIQTNVTNWLNLDSITGLLFGEPSDNDVGVYWVNISVTDGEGGWDYYNYSLNIQKSPTQEKDEPDSSVISTETFYWFVWIIIIIVILISIIIILTFRKQKKEIIHILEKREIEMIQTVKAELLSTTPSHISLPAETSTEGKVTLPAQPVVIEQLPPKSADQTQPTTISQTEEPAIIAIGTPPMPQQYQLPKTALSKEQQLNLLRERFLKGEVTEETYNKLRSEIESSPESDISLTEEEYKNQSAEEKQETSDLDEKSTEVEKEEE